MFLKNYSYLQISIQYYFRKVTSQVKIFNKFLKKFHVPAMYVPNQCQLALISNGQTSGMVLDSGEGISEFSAI